MYLSLRQIGSACTALYLLGQILYDEIFCLFSNCMKYLHKKVLVLQTRGADTASNIDLLKYCPVLSWCLPSPP